jgi:hypothetical protein
MKYLETTPEEAGEDLVGLTSELVEDQRGSPSDETKPPLTRKQKRNQRTSRRKKEKKRRDAAQRERDAAQRVMLSSTEQK